jgi:hypothetical protein
MQATIVGVWTLLELSLILFLVLFFLSLAFKNDVTDFCIAIFITTDFICALLPLHFILQLSRPFREKVVLTIIMALGLLASVCGIVKTVILKRSMDTPDIVFDGSHYIIWR